MPRAFLIKNKVKHAGQGEMLSPQPPPFPTASESKDGDKECGTGATGTGVEGVTGAVVEGEGSTLPSSPVTRMEALISPLRTDEIQAGSKGQGIHVYKDSEDTRLQSKQTEDPVEVVTSTSHTEPLSPVVSAADRTMVDAPPDGIQHFSFPLLHIPSSAKAQDEQASRIPQSPWLNLQRFYDNSQFSFGEKVSYPKADDNVSIGQNIRDNQHLLRENPNLQTNEPMFNFDTCVRDNDVTQMRLFNMMREFCRSREHQNAILPYLGSNSTRPHTILHRPQVYRPTPAHPLLDGVANTSFVLFQQKHSNAATSNYFPPPPCPSIWKGFQRCSPTMPLHQENCSNRWGISKETKANQTKDSDNIPGILGNAKNEKYTNNTINNISNKRTNERHFDEQAISTGGTIKRLKYLEGNDKADRLEKASQDWDKLRNVGLDNRTFNCIIPSAKPSPRNQNTSENGGNPRENNFNGYQPWSIQTPKEDTNVSEKTGSKNPVNFLGIDFTSENPRRTNVPPRYQCEACNKSYATFSGLSKHKQFHCVSQIKKQFSCKFCDKNYVSLGALKMHIRTHTLPCKCHLCGKAFSRPWLLQGHMRTHTGEKPFQCSHCGRSFADRSNLRAHLQTHTDIKKYNCKRCTKTFSRMSLLLKHKDGGCPGIII